jgi:hypothetical protein
MRVDDLSRVLEAGDGPTIVCAQAGNVNTGAADPLAEIAEACAAHGAWLHIDGAFGLWAAASPRLRGQVDGAGACRLVDGRRAQVAERALRLRHGRRGPSRRAPGRDDLRRALRPARGGARERALEPGVLAPGPSRPGLRGDPIARSPWRPGPRGALLRARPADGRPPRRDARGPCPQRGDAQPGAGAVRGSRSRRRRHDRGGRPCRPGRRHVLAQRHDVARPGRDACVVLELVDRRRRPSTVC